MLAFTSDILEDSQRECPKHYFLNPLIYYYSPGIYRFLKGKICRIAKVSLLSDSRTIVTEIAEKKGYLLAVSPDVSAILECLPNQVFRVRDNLNKSNQPALNFLMSDGYY